MNRKFFIIIAVLVTALAVLFGGAVETTAQVAMPNPGGVPDYFNTPNWAYSPPLRKFVDDLPGLTSAGSNSLGQYIPVANPDTTTYLGTDYYELGLTQYTEQMHSDLPNGTVIRGYYQINNGTSGVTDHSTHYLGPLIIAQKNRPVRIKFVNQLGTGAAGNLFVPVDTSVLGAGPYSIDYDPATKQPISLVSGTFAQNRATLHLHGGRSPWISDGTPHQWITPAGESAVYPKGVSVGYVPDMWFDGAGNTITACAGQTTCATPGATNNPGDGAQTFYWTNGQSSRLMFYHDHAWGITRLNVYVGEAAGYLLQDPTETNLVNAGLIPAEQIPLIIQDKTFVSEATITATDPTWNWGRTPGQGITGDFWWPHVYMPAQNPYNPNMSGVNDFGRWHYGPWFWPPTNNIPFGPVPNPLYDPACDPNNPPGTFCQPPEMPGTPNPSWGAEAFLDTPVINGTAYPKLTVQPRPYRLRILNAAHDRFWNLQLYVADPLQTDPTCTDCAPNTEVRMVSAVTTTGFPPTWPTDMRAGGVPDPATAGPDWIQIGTEGGFLPQPVVIPAQPVVWNNDVTTFNAGNVSGGSLILGPAERADVVVDFSGYAGQTLILYNDAPAPFPALDPHYDYYTGVEDLTAIGGSPGTPIGRGPNTRTLMQINVASAATTSFDLAALQAAFVSSASHTAVFETGQDPVVVGQVAYNTTYNTSFPFTWPYWGLSRISDTSISFMRPDGTTVDNFPLQPKAIQDEMGETFDEYGRMSAKLGLELPFTNAGIQTFILQNYVDPASEIVSGNRPQIWKITHNGVDTHPVHFHLFEVQLINRVGWDGFIRLPELNELGWKDTVRISPLEDTIVALRPVTPPVPFRVPDSIRPLNPSTPIGSTAGFTNLDPVTGQPVNPPVTNQLRNFGWEYVWHCHILSHEEMDMMRTIVFKAYDNIGVFRSSEWYLDVNGNGAWDAGIDSVSVFGAASDVPLTGDWTGDGKIKKGVYSGNGNWWLDRNGNGAQDAGETFSFGIAGDIPVVGDWNGDSKTKIGVVRIEGGALVWYLDMNSNGVFNYPTPDVIYTFGVAGDTPIVGDWNGNGRTKIGVFRGGQWYFDINGNGTFDYPSPDVFTFFGIPGDTPVTGDWNGSGITRVGVFRNSEWYLDVNGNNAWDPGTDSWFVFGLPTDTPIIGKW